MKKIKFLLRNRLFDREIRISELSKDTGIRRSTLDLIFKNQVQKLDLLVIAQLCEFFQCDLNDLMVLEERDEK
jgi:putative transcriptional regulator